MMRVEDVRGGIPYNFYIDPLFWAKLIIQAKEKLIMALSTAKKTIYGEQMVHILDGYSGQELGRTGITGPIIYK